MKRHLFFLFFCLFIMVSCDINSEYQQSVATIHWTGDYAADGCGFFVIINGHQYKPDDETVIGDNYKTIDDTPIILKYQVLNKTIETYCGDLPGSTLTDGIKIISIQSN